MQVWSRAGGRHGLAMAQGRVGHSGGEGGKAKQGMSKMMAGHPSPAQELIAPH